MNKQDFKDHLYSGVTGCVTAIVGSIAGCAALISAVGVIDVIQGAPFVGTASGATIFTAALGTTAASIAVCNMTRTAGQALAKIFRPATSIGAGITTLAVSMGAIYAAPPSNPLRILLRDQPSSTVQLKDLKLSEDFSGACNTAAIKDIGTNTYVLTLKKGCTFSK